MSTSTMIPAMSSSTMNPKMSATDMHRMVEPSQHDAFMKALPAWAQQVIDQVDTMLSRKVW